MITLLFKLDSIERMAMGLMLSAFIVIVFGKKFITILKKNGVANQPIREDGPATHLGEITIVSRAGVQTFTKKGSPSMGGLLIMASVLISAALFAVWNPLVVGVMFVTISYGFLGFLDDYLKIKKRNSYKGLSKYSRLIIEAIIAIIAVLIMFKVYPNPLKWSLIFPYYKLMLISFDYKVWIIPLFFILLLFSSFVIMGSANGVNITDGLDGMASRVSILIICGLVILALFMSGTIGKIPYIPETREIAVLGSIFIGALLGFLWHNSFPARIFMGDSGSLALGGAIGAMAVALKHELFLVIAGSIVVLETITSFMQIVYFRKTNGKRLFLMAPIHHHFEKKGLSEVMITERFALITFLSVVIALVLEYVFYY